ncbi:MAG TPA: hypothetical protein VIU61_22995 [Kofleriaceae bacterium]
MPKLAALVLVVLAAPAFADDVPYGPPPPPPGAEVTVTTPNATIVVTPPGGTVPVAPPAVAPAAPERADDPCVWRHASSTPRKQRFAIGFAKSKLELDDETDGKAKSILARIALHRKFEVELELTRATLGDDTAKTFGGALVREFGKRKLRPYVLAGGGGGVLERASGAEDRLRYAEFGAGLMLKKRHLAIGVDFRGGVRKVDGGADPVAMPVDEAGAMPPASDEWTKERYHRARILALFYF